MTRRDTRLPWSLRDSIRQRVAAGESRRQIAAELRVSKTTVQKYAASLVQTAGRF